MIPYIIVIARPDWKRPYCEIITDVGENETQLFSKFDKLIVNEMVELSIGYSKKFVSYSEFHEHFFSEYYMHHIPIEIKYFKEKWLYYDFEANKETYDRIMCSYFQEYDELTAPFVSTDEEDYDIDVK
jgi:hypothetical protein